MHALDNYNKSLSDIQTTLFFVRMLPNVTINEMIKLCEIKLFLNFEENKECSLTTGFGEGVQLSLRFTAIFLVAKWNQIGEDISLSEMYEM